MKYTEEEKKAIEKFRAKIKRADKDIVKFSDIYTTLDIHNLRLLLNLIEKQQMEIEKKSIELICYQNEYVPKEAIKEKIEELESYIYKGENGPQDFLQYRVKAKIQGYKELLGE